MLTFFSGDRHGDCAGNSRRDFLKIGTLGLGGFALPQLIKARAEAAQQGRSIKNKSVIWIWLGGGPTHVETFDPKMSAPVEYRSTTGEVATPVPGMTFGGTLPKLAACGDKMAVVRSFAHGDSSHGTGTRYVMTGYSARGNARERPSMGSIVSRVGGTTNPHTGMPTYVRMGRIGGDGPAFLGTASSPFDPSGQASKNLTISIPRDRIDDRRSLLKQIDNLDRRVDRSGIMLGLDGFEHQAFDLILGSSRDAFKNDVEDPKSVARYGTGLGKQLLTARRLCEAGCSFVTASYGGWDMHSNVANGMKSRGTHIDNAISALIEDLYQRGMNDDVLVVVSGEFGRTPRINKRAGRDHWGNLCTLALAGGGLKMGQVVGQSSPKVEVPASTPIRPNNLLATIFHLFGIDPKQQIIDFAGRPTNLLEQGDPIRELI